VKVKGTPLRPSQQQQQQQQQQQHPPFNPSPMQSNCQTQKPIVNAQKTHIPNYLNYLNQRRLFSPFAFQFLRQRSFIP
jgi:hypothetical protein